VLARRLIENTAVYKRAALSGVPLNVKVIEEVLVKFSQLLIDFPQIKEADINPLIVDKNSAVAVDARIVIDLNRISQKSGSHEHLVIAPYPTKYVSNWTMKNQTPVLLRPIKPEDEGRFNDLFKSLSPQTMHFRFFEIIKELSHETLTRFCNLDYDREIAIVAELSDKRIIGVGRLIVELDEKSGEFAVLVADQWQLKGLGSMLMDYIVTVARNMRLARIFATILPDNTKMIKLCEKKGFKIETLDEETVKASLVLSY